MAENTIINVNSELTKMKQNITDINYCTTKVSEIGSSAILYQTNFKINILTILTTVYALACAVLQYNMALLAVGVVIALYIVASNNAKYSSVYSVSRVLNIALVVTSIIFFLFFFNFIPIIVVMVNWIVTIMSNFKLKNMIWKISSSL